MNFDDWLKTVPETITGDSLWKMEAYRLGSARESRDWYYKTRHILGDEVANHRLNFMTQIIRLLIMMVPQQRTQGTIRDVSPAYEIDLDYLLNNVPLPEL
jgi:hypothetical protein